MNRETDISSYYFAPGDFSYSVNKFEERYLMYDYKVINRIGQSAWDFLKIGKLSGPMLEQLKSECWEDHTEKTFTKSMNEMKKIAQIGWDKYANLLCPDFW